MNDDGNERWMNSKIFYDSGNIYLTVGIIWWKICRSIDIDWLMNKRVNKLIGRDEERVDQLVNEWSQRELNVAM